MILSSAVKQFIKLKRDDHRWMKTLTTKELDLAIAALEPKPSLPKKMRDSQKVCFLLGVAYPQFSFWLEMGLGKTLISLVLLDYWFKIGRIKKALVFLRSDKAFPTWEKEFPKFGITVPFMSLEGNSTQKWEALKNFEYGIVLLTYPGTVAMCSTRIKGAKPKKRTRKKKKGLLLDKRKLAELAEGVNAVILDESTAVGSGKSLTHDLNAYLTARVDIRYALAGRPFGRDPTMLWHQQKMIDGGSSLGETLGMFRAALFSAEQNHWGGSIHSKVYKFNKRKTKILTRLMQHRSISYETPEVMDMPKRIQIREYVPFSTESQAHYRRAAKELISSRGDYTECKNLFLRMRQLTSGFIGFKDDESGDKVQISFDTNPKLDRTVEMLQSLRDTRKAVIFYDFTWSARQLVERIRTQLDRDCIWLWSGTKDSRAALKQFSQDTETGFAVVNNRVGAFSLDGLQDVANYVFFYESPVAVIDRDQAEHRVWRPGQLRKVMEYDMVVKNSVDERILEFHKEGRDLMSAIREDPSVLLE